MPELPEVENVRLSLNKRIVGRRVVSCYVRNPKIIRQPSTGTFHQDIIGETFWTMERIGKYLIAQMDNFHFVCHLAMTGALIHLRHMDILPTKYVKHAHVIMDLDDGTKLFYCDIRRFGGLRLLNYSQWNSFKPLQNLGPEPIDDRFPTIFARSLKQTKVKDMTVKEALMDQSLVAGLGNIYVCETLFDAKVAPTRKMKTLTVREFDQICLHSRMILLDSIEKGGSSISDYVNGIGQPGTYQNYLKVYGKKVCPNCGGSIAKPKIGGRSSFYCPSCQK